jgi:hypothetical protein
MFSGKAGTFRCSILGQAVALPANIRPGWKGLPGTKPLGYYEKVELTAIKCFITLAPVANVMIFISSSLTEGQNKPGCLSL